MPTSGVCPEQILNGTLFVGERAIELSGIKRLAIDHRNHTIEIFSTSLEERVVARLERSEESLLLFSAQHASREALERHYVDSEVALAKVFHAEFGLLSRAVSNLRSQGRRPLMRSYSPRR